MGHPIKVTGLVLSATPIGDYDRRVILLTRERGKISAFAKGARRQNSALMAAASPFSFGEFSLYEGRSSYNMIQAEIQNYFSELSSNFEGAYYGFYFLEFAEYYARENNDEVQMLKLLYQTLRALCSHKIKMELIRYIFELKALVINGEYPQVFECVNCGKETKNAVFCSMRGGILCSECTHSGRDRISMDASTLYTLQFVTSSSIEKLFTFTVSDGVLGEFRRIMNHYTAAYIDRKFKSLEVLNLCVEKGI